MMLAWTEIVSRPRTYGIFPTNSAHKRPHVVASTLTDQTESTITQGPRGPEEGSERRATPHTNPPSCDVLPSHPEQTLQRRGNAHIDRPPGRGQARVAAAPSLKLRGCGAQAFEHRRSDVPTRPFQTCRPERNLSMKLGLAEGLDLGGEAIGEVGGEVGGGRWGVEG